MKRIIVLLLTLSLCMAVSAGIGETVQSVGITGLGDIQNGLVMVFSGQGIGYADFQGNIVIEPTYSMQDENSLNILSDGAYQYDGNHVMVSNGMKKFIIDTQGKHTDFPTSFESWGFLHDGIVWLRKTEDSFSGGKRDVVGYFKANGELLIDFEESLYGSNWYGGTDYDNGMLIFDDDKALGNGYDKRDYGYNAQGERFQLYIENIDQASAALGLSADIIRSAKCVSQWVKKGQESGETATPCAVKLYDQGSDDYLGTIGAYIDQNGSVYCNPFQDDLAAPNILHNNIAYYGDDRWTDSPFDDVTPESFVAQYIDSHFNILFSLRDNAELWNAFTLDGVNSGTYRSGLFSDGIVVASIKRWYSDGSEENYYFTLDMNGRFVMQPRSDINWGYLAYSDQFYRVYYHSGLCPAMDNASQKWGYLSSDGNWAITPQFSEASNFSDGYAVVKQEYPPDTNHAMTWSLQHLIDAQGRIAFSTSER